MLECDYKEIIPRWLGEESYQIAFNDYTRIDVPLLDSHNDYNSIYLSQMSDGRFYISDNANSYFSLMAEGVDLVSTESRWKKAFDSLVCSLGISFSTTTNELYVECYQSELKSKMGLFIQALVRVDCLSPVSKYVLAEQKQQLKLRTKFKNLLDDNSGKYEENVSRKGTSGLNHSFDFLLKGKRNDLYVRLMQNTTKAFKESLIFEWDDVRPNIGESSLFAIKDRNEKMKEQTKMLDDVMYNKGISILSIDSDSQVIVKYLIA